MNRNDQVGDMLHPAVNQSQTDSHRELNVIEDASKADSMRLTTAPSPSHTGSNVPVQYPPVQYVPAQDAFVDDVRPYLFSWLDQGLKVALVTLVNVEGSSPRGVGSQMLVNEQGDSVGLISGGCVEAALVEEALTALTSNQWTLLRYGKDSDFFDIQLPCGSGIDVLITPVDARSDWVAKLHRHSQQRQTVTMRFDLTNKRVSLDVPVGDETPVSSRKGNQLTRAEVESELTRFSKAFQPKHRVVVIGQGAVFEYFVQLSQSFDLELVACSPSYRDTDLALRARSSIQYVAMKSPKNFDAELLDQHSSLVMLSHDHDWDTDILKAALNTQVSFISALGSKATHQQRLALLEMSGVSSENQARVKGPAGLDIGGNTPPEIALSVLSEIIAIKNRAACLQSA